MQVTARRGIQYPDPVRDDAPDIPLHLLDLAQILDLDTPWYSGTTAARPAAGTVVVGSWYWATDTSTLYLNTGVWTALAPLASPAFTGTPTAPTQASTDSSTALATTAFVRSIMPPGITAPYAGSTAPTGWLLCNGQAVSRTTYAALFALFGTTFGAGDGSTTFNLPNLSRRVPVGKDAAAPFNTLGAVGGEETHLLTIGEMPAHDHGAATGATSAGTPAGSLSNDSAGVPAGTINAVSAGTPAGTITINGSGTLTSGTESAQHNHAINVIANAANGQVEFALTTYAVAHGATDAVPIVATWESSLHGHGATCDVESTQHTHDIASHAHTGSFVGTALGTHTHVFTGSAMGSHSHTFTGTPMATHTHTIAAQGGGAAHNNIQPYLVLNYIIKI